jgi:hypothetical protein
MRIFTATSMAPLALKMESRPPAMFLMGHEPGFIKLRTDFRHQMKELGRSSCISNPLSVLGREMFLVTFIESSPPLDKNLEKGHACC